MHACIAAVSQAVPTVTLAYSKKAAGVMGMLEPAPPIVDLRSEDTATVFSHIERAFNQRDEIHNGLASAVADAQRQVHLFFCERLPRALGLSATLESV